MDAKQTGADGEIPREDAGGAPALQDAGLGPALQESALRGGPVMLYDGDCALCSASVQLVLKYDRGAVFRFAPLQGELAARVLPRHGRSPADLDTVYVLLDADSPSERLLAKSRAVLFIGRRLGGWRAFMAALGYVVPRPLLDFCYDFVARRRHRLVRRREQACWMPRPEYAGRFLD